MASAPDSLIIGISYYDGNDLLNTISYDQEVLVEEHFPALSKTGYNFLGWQLEINGSYGGVHPAGSIYNLPTQALYYDGYDTIRMTAKWEKIEQGMYWVLNCGGVDQILEEADFPNNAKYIAELGVVKAG